MRDLPADSTIISLGNYGYDWVKGQAKGTPLEFSEAMVKARDSDAALRYARANSANTKVELLRADVTGAGIPSGGEKL